MKEKVLVFDELRQRLTAGLDDAAATVTALGNVVRERFSGFSFGPSFIWLLLIDPPVQDFYHLRRCLADTILNDAADAAGLDCGAPWGPRTQHEPVYANPHDANPLAGLTDSQRINRKFVELQNRDAVNAVLNFAIDRAYIRAGVFSFNKRGSVQVVKDAAARLEDFCTLYAETSQQAAFVAALAKMRAKALELQAARQELCGTVPDKLARTVLELNAGDYAAKNLDIMPDGYGRIMLTDADAAARALISCFGLSGQTDGAPKFYNQAGTPAHGADALYSATGGSWGAKVLPKTEPERQQRRRFTTYPAIIKEG